MNLEKIADEIKLELHDKHMMYIDGEDHITHRWCKQIIWRILSKYFGNNTLPSRIVLLSRLEANVEAQDRLNRDLTDDEWQKIVKEIHQVHDFFDLPYVHMTDIIDDMNTTCQDCEGEGSWDTGTSIRDYDVCETCNGTGETE